ncbi:calcium-binding protein [Neisseria sp. CCUG12390]|uniref:calcium-binding protein n=1 Tax=Neisseria sp. CCUG12390 TaxID=3392035 RepID=UPI003A0FD0AB
MGDIFNSWKNINRDGKYHVYDPLVLDLDGDGIETVGTQGYKGALFDHDKDGIRTSTGWVLSDDGLLVIDRNSDGLINNGGELFGDSTVLKDGSNAAHGYAALAEFDTNSDGKVDAQDADFAKLKVWRDLNQDGVSQDGELFTLAELNIQSIDAAYQDVNTRLGNGNTVAQKGSYTLSDGTTREMGDLLLAADHLHSRYADSVKMTEEQMQAANLQGIGRLRDLREAAALSPDLAETLKAYSNAETKTEQQALLNKLVQEWAKTDPDYHVGFTFSTAMFRTANEGVALTPTQAGFIVGYSIPQEYLDKIQHYRQKVATLDAFSGEKSRVMFSMNDTETKRIFSVIDKAYDSLNDNVYQALLFQTRLQPYLNEIGLVLENDEFKLDYSGVLAKFGEVHAENPEKAFVDLGEFVAYSKDNGSVGIQQLSSLFAQYVQAAVAQGMFEQYAEQLGTTALTKLGHQLGTDADETLRGTDLSNFLLGGEGNDTLEGRNGDDILSGGHGNDTLSGGAGKDTLTGGLGNDKLYGGGNEADTYVFAKGHGQDVVSDSGYKDEHTDTLRFSGVNHADAVFTRYGNSLVIKAVGGEDSVTVENYFGSSSYRYYQFAFDDKTVTAADMPSETVAGKGTDNNDSLSGWDTVDVLDGGLGNDNLYGYEGSDTLSGGAGNDSLNGGNGTDTLNGGAGDDGLSGENGDDVLNGDEGHDTLSGGAGKDTLTGGLGNDKLYGGGNEADTYVFAKGHGQDVVSDSGYKDEHTDTLRFSGVNHADAVFTRYGNSLVIKAVGGEDSVTVENYFGSSSYRYYQFAFDDKTVTAADMPSETVAGKGTDNNDSLSGWDTVDVLDGGLGNDNLYGYEGSDTLSGGAGNDSLNGGNGTDTLNGGAGDDGLSGENGDDVLNGDEGHDTLSGGAGKDTLTGGLGNDKLYGGGNEADTYVFAKGHGQDVVSDSGYKDEHTDTLRFSGVNHADAVFTRYGNSLVIKAFGGEDSVTVENYFGSSSYRYYQFAFDDKTVTAADMPSETVAGKGTDNNDSLSGWDTVDVLDGGLGNDNLYGYEGSDTLSGGAGNDSLNGGNGTDTLNGGAGDDGLSGENGDDVLNGDEGHDTLSGGAGKDTLTGGLGNDKLYGGGNEADTYVFAKGHGQDVVSDSGYKDEHTDTLRFSGVNHADAVFTRYGNSLVIKAFGGEDSVTVENYFGSSSYRYYQFAFDDKTVTAADMPSETVAGKGTDNNDSLSGWDTVDVLDGGLGNDNLYGYEGSDTLSGGAGNDSLNGGNGTDTLNGGAGDDGLSGENGDDVLNGDEGHDTLSGGAGKDTLTGGLGNDKLYGGGNEADTYVFAKGHGQDVVSDSGYKDEHTDTLRFSGVNHADAVFTRYGNSLVIKAFGGEDSVTVENYFGSSSYRYYQFAFDDKTVTAADMPSETVAGKGTDNIRLNGTAGDDVLNGDEGSDTLTGGAGSDTLTGGAGNDSLNGGSSEADTYVFAKGHGTDTVSDYGSKAEHTDTLRFSGVNHADAVFTRYGNSLVIKAFGGEDSVTVENYFSSSSYRYYQFAFDDKTVTAADMPSIRVEGQGSDTDYSFYGWDTIDIIDAGGGNDSLYGYEGSDTLSGGTGNDSLNGGNGTDTLNGGAGDDGLSGENGDDVLNGDEGNDTLSGGAGKDTLTGGAGNDSLNGGSSEADTYVFAKGHGTDTVSDYGSKAEHTDTLRFSGVNHADAVFTRYGNSLVIKAFGGEDSVTVENYFSSSSYRYYQFAFDDKTVTAADMPSIRVEGQGSDTDYSFYGWDTIDIIDAGGGNDSLYGYEGSDTLSGGTGNDSLNGGNGTDTLNGGAGDDGLSGENGDDVLNGDEGNDTLSGGAGKDTLTGGAGNDSLNGGSSEADTYVFAKGHGTDTVSDYGSKAEHTDTLRFSGVNHADAVFTRYGNSLVIKAFGGEDSVTVENYFSSSSYRYYQFAFDDKTVTAADMPSIRVEGQGSDTDYSFYGWDTIDIIDAGGGNDSLYGYEGSDTLSGGTGNDSLNGGNGTDTLNGGAGDDGLNGENGDDVLNGDEGNDTLSGGAGKDTLTGGAGNDSLNGGSSEADTYVFAKGHGTDTVSDYGSKAEHTDTLRFSGVNHADAVFTRYGNSLVIKAFGGEDSVTVENYFSSSSYRYYQFAFDDKTVTAADMPSIRVEGQGSDTDYSFYGWDTIDIIDAGGGNDSLYGYEGSDTLSGGTGNDSLNGGNGIDTLNGGAGDDGLNGENGDDVLNGDEGNDTLSGGAGKDTLTGGAGNDSLNGGSSEADTYVFAKGHGTDTVSDYGSKAEHIDTLVFDGAEFSDAVFSRFGNDLVVKAYGEGDQVNVQNFFSGSHYRYTEFAFEDKTVSANDAMNAVTVV